MQILIQFLQATAWPMEPPRPGSAFHILIALAGVSLAAAAAGRTAKKVRAGSMNIRTPLTAGGLLLAFMELYKQAFLYWISGNGSYDWWYFPFQLCSVPMYLCLLLPLIKGFLPKPLSRRAETVICTFIQDFALLGGVMALAEPSGLMHPYWTLTLHGFIWHFILIFLGLCCALTGAGRPGTAGYVWTLAIFLPACLIATAINVLSHPLGNADMFYISPYYPNGQIVFHQISLSLGTLAGNLIYLLAVFTGGALCHFLCGVLNRHTEHNIIRRKEDSHHVRTQNHRAG